MAEFYKQLNWVKLEAALSQKLSRDQRIHIASRSLIITDLRLTIQHGKLVKKVSAFKKRASKLKELIGYGGALYPEMNRKSIKSIKAVEEQFFEKSPKVRGRPAQYVQLLRKSLDGVIAVVTLLESNPSFKNGGISEGQWLSVHGYFLRQWMEENKLPYKIRKDTDKIHSDNQASPFLKFYVELLKQIGRPWGSSPHALGTAIHREFRVGKSRKNSA